MPNRISKLYDDLNDVFDDFNVNTRRDVERRITAESGKLSARLDDLELALESRETNIPKPSVRPGPKNTARQKSVPEQVGKYPPLPEERGIDSITGYLGALGFILINNRPQGGGLWVLEGRDKFEGVAEFLGEHGIGTRYYAKGRRRMPGEQYELDPEKNLLE